MKKTLQVLVACSAAVFGLFSCSGGSDNNDESRGVMTMQQFYSGSRQFTLNGATQLKIYATNPQAGGAHTDTRSDAEGMFVHAVGSYKASLVYIILTQADNGLPQQAALQITFENATLAQINDNEDLISDLGLGLDGELELLQSPITILLDYTNSRAYCQFQIIQDGEEAEEPEIREMNYNLLIQPVGA